MTSNQKSSKAGVGIVLPGGGARGAYQAGSALFIAEHLSATKTAVAAIAGSSVGSLNGAVLASAPDFLQGAKNLVELWRAIGNLPSSELEIFRTLPSIELGALLSLLFAAGESTSIDYLIQEMGQMANGSGKGSLAWDVMRFLDFQPGIKINPKLQDILGSAMSANSFHTGIPFYVSVYPTRGALNDGARFLLASVSSIDTASSRLIHVQSLPDEDKRDAILASAAIPFIFDAKYVQGRMFSDGSLGDWRYERGKVPAQDLCERQKLSTLYILHCSDGSLWDRRRYTLPPTIEIRPSQVIGSGPPLDSLFFTDVETIENRLVQGYEDARRSIQSVAAIIESFDAIKSAKQAVTDSLDDLKNS